MRGSRFLCLVVGAGVLATSPLDAALVRDHRNPSKRGGTVEFAASEVFEMHFTLAAGQRLTCETRNLTPRADPVLHLIPPPGAFGVLGRIVTADDTGADLNARFTFRATRAGRHRLVLRAAHNGGTGKADLFCNGNPVAFQLPVGGVSTRVESSRTGETLTTVALPGGPRLHIVYVLDEQGRLVRRHESGANESAVLRLGVQAVRVVVVAALHPDRPGRVRLVRSDAALGGHDPDGDGLGTELEKHVGTCSSLSEVVGNWECSRSVDARDTDGDGLFDGDELLGKVASAPFQWLPRWGADPLHKDLFIEVDFMARAIGEAPRRLSPANALTIARIFADQETDPLLRLAHAQALQNPDLQPGIRVHLDIGENPPATATPEELATYGDWGGHNVAPPICDGSDCRGADAGSAWETMMEKNRRGLFHYGLGYPGSGGQAPFHTFAVNLPLDDPATAAHEMGHTLGVDHSGPRHGRPEANCKPNYPSLMSYAYLGKGGFVNTFSDGFGRPALNNVALVEVGAVSAGSVPGQRYLQHLRMVFGFNVDAGQGHVDWNRDGAFTPGSVRAYANNNGSGCELTRVNAMKLAGLTDGALALTRLGSRTMVVYGDERTRRLSLEFTDDPLTCPDFSSGTCGPPFKSKAIDEVWNRDVLSVDAHPFQDRDGRKILVVFRTSSGLFETKLSADLTFSSPRRVPITGSAADEFSLAGGADRTVLAFKNEQGQIVTKTRANEVGGVWAADELARVPSGAPIEPLNFLGAPGLLEATYPDGTTHLFLAAPVTDTGALRLYERDPVTRRWVQSPWLTSEEPAFGRPALAFEHLPADSPLPGRLHIFSMRVGNGQSHIVRHHMLQAVGVGAAATPRMFSGDHDNSFFFGNGVDLWFEAGVDGNLRGVVATAMLSKGVPQPHVIQFRPKADGIADFVQRNGNDWEALGIDLCRTLHLGGAQVTCRGFSF